MSSFTKKLIVEPLDNSKFKLHEEFDYHVGYLGSNEIVIVPKGFVTDFLTIPAVLKPFFPVAGKYTKAAVLHDFLYSNKFTGNYTRKRSDEIFLEALLVLGVNKILSFVFYYAVRIFGRSHYRRSNGYTIKTL